MIGVGIFTTTGFLAGDLGDPVLVLAIWVVGAGIALAGALCYSELAVNFPRSGGEYVYLSEAWGRMWGFIDGWVSFFAGFSAPIAAAALAISAYLAYFFPVLQIDSTADASVAGLQVGGGQIVASAIVAVFTALNLFGVSQVAKLQNVLTVTKLLVIGMLLIMGFTLGTGDWSHFSEPAIRTSTNSLAAQFANSLVFVFYAYSGWNAAVYVAEEIHNPERTLPIALTCGTLAVSLLYVALNALFIYANVLEDMKGVVAVGAHAATALFGDRGGGLFSAAMAVSLLATVNAMSMIGPRVVLCDGTRRRILFRSRESAFALAYPLGSRTRPGHLCVCADIDRHVRKSRLLHRFHSISLLCLVGARDLQISEEARLETLALGGHGLSTGSADLHHHERLGICVLRAVAELGGGVECVYDRGGRVDLSIHAEANYATSTSLRNRLLDDGAEGADERS